MGIPMDLASPAILTAACHVEDFKRELALFKTLLAVADRWRDFIRSELHQAAQFTAPNEILRRRGRPKCTPRFESSRWRSHLPRLKRVNQSALSAAVETDNDDLAFTLYPA